MKIFLIVLLCLCSFGCATTQYIVLRDVPTNPVITVIPETMDKKDIQFASRITRELIKNKVKVIERPAMITQTTKANANIKQTGWNPETGVLGTVTGSGVKGESVSQTQTGDIVDLYSKTTADYIFVTQYPDTLKIVKRDSNEILFNDRVFIGDYVEGGIEKILVNLGIIWPYTKK